MIFRLKESAWQGHVHDFYLPDLLSAEVENLLHISADYALNEIPHPEGGQEKD